MAHHLLFQRHGAVLVILIGHLLKGIDEGNHFKLVFADLSAIDFPFDVFEGGEVLEDIVELEKVLAVEQFFYFLEVDCDG